jgi:hypothetical protein
MIRSISRLSLLLWTFTTVTVSVVASAPAQACKCMLPPVEAAREDSTAVFEGRVLSIEDVPPAKDAPGIGEKVVTLAVVRTWKGLERDERITVSTNAESAACGYNFAKDTSYLVYARSGEDTKLNVSSCSRTKPLADAAEDLQVLGAGSTPVHVGDKAATPAPGSAAAPATAPAQPAPAAPAKKKGCSVIHVGANETTRSAWLLALPLLVLVGRRQRRLAV